MKDQFEIPCVREVFNFFDTNFLEWVTIPQIAKACHLQHNTCQKAIHFIRKNGRFAIERGPRIYTRDNRYYHKYRMVHI